MTQRNNTTNSSTVNKPSYSSVVRSGVAELSSSNQNVYDRSSGVVTIANTRPERVIRQSIEPSPPPEIHHNANMNSCHRHNVIHHNIPQLLNHNVPQIPQVLNQNIHHGINNNVVHPEQNQGYIQYPGINAGQVNNIANSQTSPSTGNMAHLLSLVKTLVNNMH